MDPALLAAELRASRTHLTRITADLDGNQLLGPKLTIVNPPLWELGHVAWFQEFWCLRNSSRGTPPEALVPGADALYNSAEVAHDTRWNLTLPDLKATRSYQAEVLERVLGRIEREPENRELHYFVQLAIFHEDMHAEAFHYTRQTLEYGNPFPENESAAGPPESIAGDAELPGGTFMLGANQGSAFVFDNEKWAHEVEIRPFRLSRTAVTNAEFSAFVDAGGYNRREWWSDEGWEWRNRAGLAAPKYWVRQDDAWLQRRFERVVPLRPSEPVLHVNWHEANAYCRFAGRRLPTESEWEYAASWDPTAREKRRYPWGSTPPATALANLETAGLASVESYTAGDSASGCRQLMGNVWEWTTTTFGPYPGFIVDPYKEYSEPWFGTHKVLRGGSFATTRRLIRNTWRNFYTPDRNDVFAGFRTCALDR
ncbi:MAG: ergothioneine biosynthesis protein EgtB [Betaproteobacteria bacterium]|nr:ergothioneine biosynthesis protein EgtB [Betaproteobacteria bacterium]MDH3435899.1 ergothioneine biosynthesis protein EgtB [Betaproteobacteria bacterium]